MIKLVKVMMLVASLGLGACAAQENVGTVKTEPGKTEAGKTETEKSGTYSLAQITEASEEIVKFTEKVVSLLQEVLNLQTNKDSEVSIKIKEFLDSKKTYCCFLNREQSQCRQFRAYSHEAFFVCLRMASGNGILKRGECPEGC